jgi:hypothetical protein
MTAPRPPPRVVVMRCLAYQFNFDFHVTVLWALGWAMIAWPA